MRSEPRTPPSQRGPPRPCPPSTPSAPPPTRTRPPPSLAPPRRGSPGGGWRSGADASARPTPHPAGRGRADRPGPRGGGHRAPAGLRGGGGPGRPAGALALGGRPLAPPADLSVAVLGQHG